MVTALSPILEHELDKLIEVLEAQIPANPQSAANRRAAIRLERVLKQYFTALENALSEDIIEQLYYKYVVQEAKMGKGAWDGIHSTLDPILAMFHDTLRANIAGQVTEIYISGSADMVTWGHTLGGVPIAYEGPPIAQAIDWAEKHCATLVTRMDEETKRRLAKVIADGIEGKRGVPGLARDLRGDFADMRRYRSMMIARTETANALSQSSLDTMKDMGIDGKEWVVAGDPCAICIDNAAAGIISVNDVFPSGDASPPAHPNCECALAPGKMPITEAMTPSDWKAEYKKGVPHWAKGMEPSIFAKEFVKLLKDHEIDNVLEIGCGNGRDSILFAKSDFIVTSIDIVPKAIELAKKNALNAKVDIGFRVANVERLPFGDSSFGAVFTLSVLHSTDLKKSLPEVARVLSPKGIAFIYIYGDTQFEDGKAKEDTIKFNDYLKALEDVKLKVLKSYTEQQDKFDEFGEKHRIFVVFLEKET